MDKLTVGTEDGQPFLMVEQRRVELSVQQVIQIVSALSTDGVRETILLGQGGDGEHPTPASMPHVSPVLLRPVEKPQELHTVRYTRAAESIARSMGLDDDRVLRVLNHPEREHILDSGKVVGLIGDGLGLKVFLDSDTILGVFPAHRLERELDEDLMLHRGDRRRTSGGSGGSYPKSMDDLVNRLKDRGCEVSHTKGGHLQASLRGNCITLPSTPSDNRSVINTVKAAERHLGVDLRNG